MTICNYFAPRPVVYLSQKPRNVSCSIDQLAVHHHFGYLELHEDSRRFYFAHARRCKFHAHGLVSWFEQRLAIDHAREDKFKFLRATLVGDQPERRHLLSSRG